MVFKAILILVLAAVVLIAVGLAFLRFWPSVGKNPDREARIECLVLFFCYFQHNFSG